VNEIDNINMMHQVGFTLQRRKYSPFNFDLNERVAILKAHLYQRKIPPTQTNSNAKREQKRFYKEDRGSGSRSYAGRHRPFGKELPQYHWG
jgi:hypothetical protein